MAKIKRLYRAAVNSPHNFRFDDLCALAEAAGFRLRRSSGSHFVYKHPAIQGLESMLNIQNDNGKAKPAQIKELVKIIDAFELLGDEDV